MSLMVDTQPRDFLSIADLSPAVLVDLVDRAAELKAGRTRPAAPLAGMSVALIFQKPSLRTRVSFELGITQLGGTPIVLQGSEVGLGSREAARDAARTLERYVDVIVARVFDHDVLEEMAAAVAIPVVNALSDREHPCQALADMLTIHEHLGGFAGRRLVYVGDGNNVAASLLLAGASLGLDVRTVTPRDHAPDGQVVALARSLAVRTGALIEVEHDPAGALVGADAVYTDVWASMGQEKEAVARRDVFRAYALTPHLLAQAPDAMVMHCLPAHRGEEIEGEVLDGPQSVVFDQAENRLWTQQALLAHLAGRTWQPAFGQEPLCLPLAAASVAAPLRSAH